MTVAGRRIEVRGTVQGVGFRPWICRLAREDGIAGRIRNDGYGVTIEAFGHDAALDAFLRHLETEAPPAARIRELTWARIAAESTDDFVIESSRTEGQHQVSIPADLATCSRCLEEVRDPLNRRFRYAFTNCTDCGPRFTIAWDVPYDRERTTMAGFALCAACRLEYETLGDRRFHAQPNACPVCGPRLRLVAVDGQPLIGGDPIRRVARALEAGSIVCIKGIGGFHLACDATSELVVAELRQRKRREAKPLAVMVRDLDAAGALAVLSSEETKLLTSVERPIVLVRRRSNAALAAAIAPNNPWVGLLLPYSPLHHLLLSEVDRPLVMTSGNLSEEPIVYRDTDALERLAPVADLFLLHDREIATACDDSVARVIAGRPVVLRRARGHVPRPLPLAQPLARPILACGGHLKNTFCLAQGQSAFLGPHIGDLENLQAFRSFEEAVVRMERFLDICPQVVAHDLHPSYATTTYALARPEPIKIAVQHHHAHVASAMAEHALTGPALGIAYDGTGYGTDETAWGGEVLRADYCGFERLATFRPLPLAGGDVAIREVWRIALAAVDDAFAGAPPTEAIPLFAQMPADSIRVARQMIAAGFNSPLVRGVGRYYDAVGAIVLASPRSRFEGQVAMALDFAADADETESYRFTIEPAASGLLTVDLRTTIQAVVSDLIANVARGVIAARFQNTIVAATVDCVAKLGERVRGLPIVLTGGCFQNARLASEISSRLGRNSEVFLHRDVPPGDGGLALGQALVADAVLRRGRGWGEMASGSMEWVKCA